MYKRIMLSFSFLFSIYYCIEYTEDNLRNFIKILYVYITVEKVFIATLFLFLGVLFCGHLTLFKTFKICSLQEELVIWF